MSQGPRHPTVLHINTARGWRGGERQLLWLTERLNRAGVRSIVAARPDQPLAAYARERNLPFVPFAPRAEWDLFAVTRLRRVMRHYRASIVHAHDGHAVALGALAVCRRRVDFVVSRRVHFRIGGNALSRWKYGRADAVIAVSRAVADVLADCGVARDRITVVHSGVDLSRRVEPACRRTLDELGIAAWRPLVVMVGALVPHKDPLTFVRAVDVARARTPDVQALIVGDGPLRASVAEAVRGSHLEGVVRLAGTRTDADSLLAAANVAVLSSSGEGLGTVLLDALSWGVPVAATATNAIREVIGDGVHGLLVPIGDAQALGCAVARLLLDRPMASRLAAAGAERVRDFAVDRTAAATVAVYRRLPHARSAW